MSDSVKEIPAEQSARDVLHSDDATWRGILGIEDEAETDAPEQEETPDTGEPVAEAEAAESEVPPETEPQEDEAEAEAEAEGDEAAKAEKDPEGAEAKDEAAQAEKPKPITEFKVLDAEGEVEVPPLEIEFKANGAVRKMPLDKVVRLAQSGFYNEQLQEEVRAFREEKPALQRDMEELEALAQRQAQLIREVMEDEQAYLRRQEQYKESQSPESRAARAEAQLRAERERLMQVQSQQHIAAFLSEMGPKVDALVGQYPTVTEEEAAGWLAPQLKRLERAGAIPVERLGDVERLVTVDLPEWLAQRHESRTAKTREAETKRQLSLRKVQVEAAKAKQKLARAVAPTRTATAPSSTREPNAAPKSAKEAVDSFFKAELGG